MMSIGVLGLILWKGRLVTDNEFTRGQQVTHPTNCGTSLVSSTSLFFAATPYLQC